MTDSAPYNPLDKKNLGASVAEAMLGRKPRPLAGLSSFSGAGIYAIYYRGDFPAYARLSERNVGDDPIAPIYVGKAVPEGARKGGVGTGGATTKALFKRLSEHANSINSTSTLRIDDFLCRYLVVDDIWIPLGESLLIAKFTPLWNSTVDGFGSHNTGKGRFEGMRPRWDVLHPGRGWAERCKPRLETPQQIALEVQTLLEQTQPPASPHFLVEQPRAKYRVEPE
jgi:Eco29kI restriction endonuclease